MSTPLSRLSVAAIRARCLEGAPVSAQLLARLGRDPRKGVQQIHHLLKRRHEAARAERRRLEAMLHLEQVLWRSGLERIAGVDEVGAGCLAGPVIASAVVFPPGVRIDGIDDSKRLAPEERERLAEEIGAKARGIGVGQADVEEIDRLNVYHAALLAMRRAVEALPCAPQHLLVDARTIPGLAIPQNAFDKGDGINFSIAAASIVAKVRRDRMMMELDAAYPGYGFARHKGYGTPEHQRAIRGLGPCPLHRLSFPFLAELQGAASPDFYRLLRRVLSAKDGDALRGLEQALQSAVLPAGERRKLRALLNRRWRTV